MRRKMHFFNHIAVSLLLATSVLAIVSPRDGLIREARDANRKPRQIGDQSSWTKASYCTQTGIISDEASVLAHPPATKTFDYAPFCSAILQPTTVIWITTTLSSPVTIVQTSTLTTSTSTTTTNAAHSTITDYCPAPSTSQRCGIQALGLLQYSLYHKNGLDAVACHQLCLSDKKCKSFQIVPQDDGSLRCNVYSTSVAGHVSPSPGDAVFYDRGCGDFVPAGCTRPKVAAKRDASPAPTPAAELHVEFGKRDVTTPDFIATFPAIVLPFACSCLITSAAPEATNYATSVVQIYDYITTTSVKTVIASFTAYPNRSTVYKTVA